MDQLTFFNEMNIASGDLGTFTEVGWIPPERELTEAETGKLITIWAKLNTGSHWNLGDLIGYDRKWHKYDHWAFATGYKKNTLRDIVYTCRNVKLSSRLESLSIWHHHVVATLPDEEQKQVLQLAADNEWSRPQLKQYVRGLKAIGQSIQKNSNSSVDIINGDCFLELPNIPDNTINLLIADPPYNTTKLEWDQMGTRDEFVTWSSDFIDLVIPKMADEWHAFIFCDPDYFADWEMVIRSKDLPLLSRVIWQYRNLVKGRDVASKFIENYQVCLHMGTHALNWPPEWDDRRFMVQTHSTPQSNFNEGRFHPTQKPLNLIKLFVEIGSSDGDTILDPFAGSGTTAISCLDVGGRSCIMIEQDASYCNVIRKRLSEYGWHS